MYAHIKRAANAQQAALPVKRALRDISNNPTDSMAASGSQAAKKLRQADNSSGVYVEIPSLPQETVSGKLPKWCYDEKKFDDFLMSMVSSSDTEPSEVLEGESRALPFKTSASGHEDHKEDGHDSSGNEDIPPQTLSGKAKQRDKGKQKATKPNSDSDKENTFPNGQGKTGRKRAEYEKTFRSGTMKYGGYERDGPQWVEPPRPVSFAAGSSSFTPRSLSS